MKRTVIGALTALFFFMSIMGGGALGAIRDLTPQPTAEPAAAPETAAPVAAILSAPRPSPRPQPTAAPEPTEEPEPEFDVTGHRLYLTVNVTQNVVIAYADDENGEFTIPCKAMICSTGDATPHWGVYRLGWRLRWQTLFGGVYGQYAVQIVGNILFHSVPYTEYGNPASLEYWEFDKLGTSASMGCVRLQVKDVKWIYDNFSSIAAVEFYESDEPEPLERPEAPKISDNEVCRDWDPTDDDPSNPWLIWGEDVPEGMRREGIKNT